MNDVGLNEATVATINDAPAIRSDSLEIPSRLRFTIALAGIVRGLIAEAWQPLVPGAFQILACVSIADQFQA